MVARRALVVFIALLVAIGLGFLLLRVLAPGGWTLAKLVMLFAFIGTAPWTGLCVANGLIGFLLLMLAPAQAEISTARPRGEIPRTAIVVDSPQ